MVGRAFALVGLAPIIALWLGESTRQLGLPSGLDGVLFVAVPIGLLALALAPKSLLRHMSSLGLALGGYCAALALFELVQWLTNGGQDTLPMALAVAAVAFCSLSSWYLGRR